MSANDDVCGEEGNDAFYWSLHVSAGNREVVSRKGRH